MKQEYLDELKRLLEEENIENKEEILSKYEKRYDFGKESELTDEEIERMLGRPQDVINKIKGEESKNKNKGRLSLKVVTDDVKIGYSKDAKAHVLLSDVDRDSFNIDVNSTDIIVEYITSKYLGLNRKGSGEITVLIPEGRTFKSTNIETTSGDVDVEFKVISDNISIQTVSGDIDIESLDAKTINVNVVSCDLDADYIKCDKLQINTVSGDVDIDNVDAEKITIDNVSGDVTIKETNANSIVTNCITGDIKVNGREMKNFTKIVKEKFKKE